jgi:hypothetical protein
MLRTTKRLTPRFLHSELRRVLHRVLTFVRSFGPLRSCYRVFTLFSSLFFFIFTYPLRSHRVAVVVQYYY